MNKTLTKLQIDMLHGLVCPYCKRKSVYTDSSVIYGKSFGMIYWCEPCDAYCGVHKGTNKALGRLANKELRFWKKEAHKYFDILWQDKNKKRSSFYHKLSLYLEIQGKYTHIGMFSIATCKKVVDWSKMILNDINKIDNDF